MSLPIEIIDAIEELVVAKFNQLVAANKLDVTSEATDLEAFEEQYMASLDGNEYIRQDFFRTFLAWLGKYYTYYVTLEEETVLAACKYITPVDLAGPPDCAKIIAPFAFLIVTGAGVKPTVPDPATTTPDEVGFDQSTDIMDGAFAYNNTDNKWYYRGVDTIYELKDALSLGVADIANFATTVNAAITAITDDLEPKQTGKSLSANDLTDILKTAYDGAVTHAGLTTIHIEVDGTTIEVTGGNKLGVIASAIKALFSGTLPITFTDGVIALAYNTDQFEVVADKLQIKAGVLGGGDPILLSFNEGTSILTIGVAGAETVDLSILAGGDLSNYVKKTGAANQTIEGNLKTTGECEAYGT